MIIKETILMFKFLYYIRSGVCKKCFKRANLVYSSVFVAKLLCNNLKMDIYNLLLQHVYANFIFFKLSRCYINRRIIIISEEHDRHSLRFQNTFSFLKS